MNKRIVIFTISIISLIVIISCTSMESPEVDDTKTVISDEKSTYDIKESALVEKQISIFKKYNELIPSIINDLNQCAPVQDDPAGEMWRFTQSVINYAGDLEALGYDDTDRITVQNEKYWKAIFSLSAKDITVLLTRMLLLMRDGQLKRAEMVFLYCIYDRNTAWERDQRLMETVWDDITEIRTESEQLIEAGIREWDMGNRKKAVDLYHKALTVYPKSPWALYEISYDLLTYELTAQQILDGKNEPYYRLIRHLDPMYWLAYQGKPFPNRPRAVNALTNKVEPSYSKLWKGEAVNANMKELADGYYEMEEYEFALYAYKYLLFHTYNRGFDQYLIRRITLCLEKLEMNNVVTFLNEFLVEVERTLNPES